MNDEQKPADGAATIEPGVEPAKARPPAIVLWQIAFGFMCFSVLADQVTIANKNRAIDNQQSTIGNLQATIGMQQQTISLKILELNELKLQLDVLRRAELDRQMNWRKNFIPHEVRDLFEREA